MRWLRRKVDLIGQGLGWTTALCSLVCAALAFVPVSALWVAGIGLGGGIAGLAALWANALASQDRDERIAVSERLSLDAITTLHANAPQF